MGWWKADPVLDPAPKATPLPRPHSPPSPTDSDSASACPVDEKTRSVWLQAAQSCSQPQSHPSQPLPSNHPPLPPTTNPSTASRECSSDRISQSPHPPPSNIKAPRPLSLDREISSIPRASDNTPQNTPFNSESETGQHASGNWIYPSESQFYRAVMSKNTASSPDALLSSISHIIPIHNAVNERAWSLIREWEGSSSDRCGGPKLHSFAGRGAGALTPKAKWNAWVLGSQEPFDRHDWVVERCTGEKVDYVIDFYQGKADPTATKKQQGNLNFYLDVRPKLNTLTGWQMRAEKIMGLR